MKKNIKDFQYLFYNYLRDKGPDKIKWYVVCQNYDKVGIKKGGCKNVYGVIKIKLDPKNFIEHK